MSTYALICGCGRSLSGTRKAKAHVIVCPQCAGRHFVLARSPLPPAGKLLNQSSAFPPWLLPFGAAAITLAIVGAGLFLFLSYLNRSKPDGPSQENRSSVETERALRASIQQGNASLRMGKFNVAAQQLQDARVRERRSPQWLSHTEKRQLELSVRQAKLLSELLQKRLEDLVREAQGQPPDEWSAQFKTKYLGKAILFDDLVERMGPGQYRLRNYRVMVGENGTVIRVELPLRLFDELPLRQPRRLIFGARLQRIHRRTGGEWIIRTDPASGVLMTDEETAAVCGWPTISDTGVVAVLKWQRDQLAQ